MPTRRQLDTLGEAMGVVARETEQLQRQALRALAPVLEEARATLASELKRWLLNVKEGAQRFTAQRYRVALSSIDQALRAIDERMLGVLSTNWRAAATMAARHLTDQIATFGHTFGMSARPPFELSRVVRQLSDTVIRHHNTSVHRYRGRIRRDLQGLLATSVLRGETMEEFTNRLVAHGGPRGLVALRGIVGRPGARVEYIVEGLFQRYRYWGERVARTEVMAAYNDRHHAALVEVDAQDPGYQQRWDAAADRRTCDVCGPLDGKTAAMEGVFPGGFRRPPAHPNCRCTLTPWRREWGTRVVAPETTARSKPPPRVAPKPSSVTPPIGRTLSDKERRREFQAFHDHLKGVNEYTGAWDNEAVRGAASDGGDRFRRAVQAILLDEYGIDKANKSAGQYTLVRADTEAVAWNWDDVIVVGNKTFRKAQRAFAAKRVGARDLQSVKTLFHEEIHSSGGGVIRVDGLGFVIEEASTELLARRVIRTRYASPTITKAFSPKGSSVNRSYQQLITKLADQLHAATGGRKQDAWARLDDAALQFKRDPTKTTTDMQILDKYSRAHRAGTRAIRGECETGVPPVRTPMDPVTQALLQLRRNDLEAAKAFLEGFDGMTEDWHVVSVLKQQDDPALLLEWLKAFRKRKDS
ncbi:MAG: phage head morphogenesis protein [Proteobacteria bacterium]|nr:phage head morphogenesis protein [Pseudomonadota bacterium]